MKIAIISKIPNFTEDLQSYWQTQGHQTRWAGDFSKELGSWMDAAFFDFVGYELAEASRSKWGGKKPLVGRLNRIEFHEKNLERYDFDWSKIKALVFGSKWYLRLTQERYPKLKDKVLFCHVPYGVDLNRFGFRSRNGSGRNIAWVAKSFSWKKGPIQALMALHMLVSETNENWQLYMKGGSEESGISEWKDYLLANFPSISEHVAFVSWVPDINEWLEPMDYILSTSFLEAFHYAVGEAMAKGIKPLIHCWAGSLEIWPRKYIWLSHQELLRMIQGPFNSGEYRDFIKENYPLKKMASKLEELLSG